MDENITLATTPPAHVRGAPERTGCYVCRFHGGELDNDHIVRARRWPDDGIRRTRLLLLAA